MLTQDPQCQRLNGKCDCQIVLWCKKYEWNLTMKTNTTEDAEVVDFKEAVQAKVSGSGGGFNFFPGMSVGSKFLVIPNGSYDSKCSEYVLTQKLGVSVLLWNVASEEYERHLGQKFWTINTLVQILHDPEADKVGQPPP